VVQQPVPFTKAKRAQSTTDDETWVDGKVNPTISLFDQGDTRATTVAVVGTDLYNGAITGDVAATMGTPGSSVNASGPTVMAFDWQSGGDARGLDPKDTAQLQRCQTPAVAFKRNGAKARSDAIFRDVTPTLGCAGGNAMPSIQQAMTVRRLTPRECERLQGFPDDWTLIPWRNKSADQCPDGPRYKALGNSMAVNCMAWIGERIAAAERNP
jgi:site-specific DNA-cytosine methylase